MAFKNGEMAIQELGSSKYKSRDAEDMAKHGKKQQFQVLLNLMKDLGMDLVNANSETLDSCPCWASRQL